VYPTAPTRSLALIALLITVQGHQRRYLLHLLAVVQMMGDTSVATVNRHYFKMEPELMRELVLGWQRPDVDVPSIASAELFGSEQPRICDMPLALAS